VLHRGFLNAFYLYYGRSVASAQITAEVSFITLILTPIKLHVLAIYQILRNGIKFLGTWNIVGHNNANVTECHNKKVYVYLTEKRCLPLTA